MATILAYTSPAFGNLFPIIALLIELQRRGHHIVVKTLGGGVSTTSDLGFEASAIDSRIEAAVDRLDGDQRPCRVEGGLRRARTPGHI